MFGYKYGIVEDDKGNKVLNLSVSFDYITTFSDYKDEINVDTVEQILDLLNPVGIIIEAINEKYNKDFR